MSQYIASVNESELQTHLVKRRAGDGTDSIHLTDPFQAAFKGSMCATIGLHQQDRRRLLREGCDRDCDHERNGYACYRVCPMPVVVLNS